MAIVTMKKFTLLAFHEHKPSLLKELQKFGDVHFRNLQDADLEDMDFLREDYSPEQALQCEAELDQVKFALSRLAPHAPKGKMTDKRPTLDFTAFDNYLSGYDYKAVCDRVKEADDRISSVRSEISRLRSENEGLRSWGQLDVSPRELDALETVKAVIGTVNKAAVDAFAAAVEQQFPNVYQEGLGAIKDDSARLLLVPADEFEDLFNLCKDLGFSRTTLNFTEIPRELIVSNNTRIDELEREGKQAQEVIASLGSEHSQLLIVQDYLSTVLVRERARANFMALDSVVVMEGWIPAEDEGALQAILTKVCGSDCYLELQEAERDSLDVPVKLKNNKVVSAFTDITSMFSAPRYNEIDPTPVLTPFYWLFFGLMVGDAGYGLLMLIGTALAGRLLDLKDGMKNFLKFFFYLSFAVILGGVLYGSFFGFPFFTPVQGPEGPKAILDSQLDIPLMLVLSIFLGIVHIIVGLLTKTYMGFRDGDIASALFDGLLWIVTLLTATGLVWGSGLIGGTSLDDTLFAVCKWGFVLSLIGLAATQGRENESLGGKIGYGLYGVYGLSGYVGDVVSYTRIVALALSGAYIAYSFNMIATDLIPAPASYIIGPIIGVIGHTLNIGLALLGAYVHTCRLQYVEFFGKFYDGGGKPFAPLKIQNNYVHINK